MIVATRLSAVWQVAGVAGAALCCYLVSQSVAAERVGLEKVDRQIAGAHDDIAKLQTEIGVRARQGQLEAWNRDVLALQAPRPSQFVSSGVQLASLYGRHGQPTLRLDPAIAAQQGSPTNVAYRSAPSAQPQPVPAVSQAPAPVPAQPMLRTATYVRPAPAHLSALGSEAAPVLRKVSFEVIRSMPPAVHADPDTPERQRTTKVTAPVQPKVSEARTPRAAPAKSVGKAKSEPVRLAARDPLPRNLLPADIGALAVREAHGARDSSKAGR